MSCRWVFALVLLWAGSAVADAQPISSGDWLVVEVRIDETTERRIAYSPDDRRLLHRVVRVRPHELVVDAPEYTVCTKPAWMRRETTAGVLWSVSFESSVSPAHWGFPLPDREFIRVYELACENERYFGPSIQSHASESRGTWLYPLADGRIALRWYDQTLLILRKIQPGERPFASYDCAKAVTATERKICSTHVLAGFDRSIGELYRIVHKYAEETELEAKRIQAQQRMWLVKRNACGSDAQCLRRSMQTRLQELAQEPG